MRRSWQRGLALWNLVLLDLLLTEFPSHPSSHWQLAASNQRPYANEWTPCVRSLRRWASRSRWQMDDARKDDWRKQLWRLAQSKVTQSEPRTIVNAIRTA